MGVHSKSQETSIRIYKGQTRYDQWNFVVTAVNRPGGGMGATMPGGQGGAQLPGARGGRATLTRAPTCPAAVAVAAPDRIFRRPHRRPHPQVSRVGRRRRRRPEPLNGWPSLLDEASVRSAAVHPVSASSIESFCRRFLTTAS